MKNTILLFVILFIAQLGISQDVLPPNMFADEAHAPFLQGVASGDPLTDRVMIWTRITPADTTQVSATVNWEVALTSTFEDLVNSGTIETDTSRDLTVKIDVDGLEAYTTYYYRFEDGAGNYSVVGRTKTAPTGPVNKLKFAVASCSSVFSGFFNAYARIAERDDLDLMIHLGDYIYDFIDEDERVRVPEPEPIDPETTEEWRDMHQYYALDPDFRAARQMHPWFILWDNHDVQRNMPEPGVQAFLEWTPTRSPIEEEPTKVYRKLSYGDLVDVFLMDILLFREQDTLANGDFSILGNEQYEWLTTNLASSTATWKVVGGQKMFGLWSALTVPADAPIGTDGDVFDSNAWDGFQESRKELLAFLQENEIDNTIFLSGDAHISMTMDLPLDPLDETLYDGGSGEGSIAVEFLPASISRGNLDEIEGVDAELIALASFISGLGNPHHQYTEFTKHGYGLLTIEAEKTFAQIWYSDILEQTDTEALGGQLEIEVGANRWKRGATGLQTNLPAGYSISKLYPNPTSGQLSFNFTSPKTERITLNIYNSQLKRIGNFSPFDSIADQEINQEFSVEGFAPGLYWVVFQNEIFQVARPFIKR